MTADLEARIENAISRTLAGHGWFVPLSVRHLCALAVGEFVRECETEDEDHSTGCCARDGIDCPSCMTGRHSECSECVHYDDSGRDDDDDIAFYDEDED